MFNPKFNFDNFIVGENNRFATEAGLHITQSPGEYYNPLLLIGDSGVGKTPSTSHRSTNSSHSAHLKGPLYSGRDISE